jgi:hypothetical protein
MSTAQELIRIVESRGGRLTIEGEKLVIEPGNAAAPVMEELRANKPEIIALLQSRIDQETESAPDGDSLPGDWLLERCVYRDRWRGGVGCLYLDAAQWCAEHGRAVPASRRAFVKELQAEGFQVTSDGLVAGLILRALAGDESAYLKEQRARAELDAHLARTKHMEAAKDAQTR